MKDINGNQINHRTRSKKENFVISRNKDFQVDGDYYATPPVIIEELIKHEELTGFVWEPCCGEGHISKVLINAGLDIFSSDLYDRGYGIIEDFLTSERVSDIIITNPPFNIIDTILAKAKAKAKAKIILIASTNFLKGKIRVKNYTNDPEWSLTRVYLMDTSINFYKNGIKPEKHTGFMTSCIVVFERGCFSNTELRFLNV